MSRAVCVLGMHRSGTSAVASLVRALGAHFGEAADLLDPLPENPRGYWEHRDLKAVNDALLRRLGGQWHTPPVLARGWEDAPELDDLRARASSLLRAHFATHSLWGWKDPRTCLTLPFWQPWLTNPRYVICLRHPTAVARSLAARDDLPLEHGLRLWLMHTAAAFANTTGDARVVVDYDDLLTNPDGTAAALATFLGRPALPAGMAAATVHADLRHHRAPSEDRGRAPGRQPAPAMDAYAALRSIAPRLALLAPENDAALTAAASEALAAQVAIDRAAGEYPWLTAPPALALPASAVAVSRLRRRTRAFLARRPALAIAYRRVRRPLRRWLRLGP